MHASAMYISVMQVSAIDKRAQVHASQRNTCQRNTSQLNTNNRLRSGWAKTASFLAKIGATDSEWCPCGILQTVHQIINACPLFGAPSGPQGIKSLDSVTRAWLETQLPL